MTKRRHPLSVHGVILRGLDEVGGYAEAAVKLPHRSEKWLRAATDPDLDGQRAAHLTYADARALSCPDVLTFAQDLAERCNMHLVPGGESDDAGAAELMARAANIMAATGKSVSTLVESCADGVIEAHERHQIMLGLLDLQRQITEALRSVSGPGTHAP